MKSIDHPQAGRVLAALVAVAGATLGVAGLLKLATAGNAAGRIDPALFFLTATEVQALGGLLEVTAAFVLLSRRFSMYQKYVVLASLTTLFCAYRHFALPLASCACVGSFEKGWVTQLSSGIATALLGFYLTLSALTGAVLAWKPSLFNPTQAPS